MGEPKGAADLIGANPLRLLQRAAQAGLGPGLDGVVVTGAHTDALRPWVHRDFEQIHHPHWEAGRTGSLAAAVRRLPDRDLCFAPVDVPCVPAEVFRSLESAWRTAGAPPEGWLAPYVDIAGRARFGHPLILGRELARRTLTMDADHPLRELRSQAAPLLSTPVVELEILDDLDTPGDLRELRSRRLRSRSK